MRMPTTERVMPAVASTMKMADTGANIPTISSHGMPSRGAPTALLLNLWV